VGRESCPAALSHTFADFHRAHFLNKATDIAGFVQGGNDDGHQRFLGRTTGCRVARVFCLIGTVACDIGRHCTYFLAGFR
jgi:hypothetical protein